jgi:hypothetical protein
LKLFWHHIWKTPGTIPTVKHHAVGIFFSSRDWETSQEKINNAKYREILNENLFQSTLDLRLG